MTEKPDTAPEPDEQPDTAASDAQDADEDQDAGDVFPRHVVQRLRKENAAYRGRAKTAEQQVETLQKQQAEEAAKSAGITSKALWATTELADLLDDDGTVSAEKIDAAIRTARKELGVGLPARPKPQNPSVSGLLSGSGVPQEKPPSWSAAFAPSNKK